jgi:hypothetical protein
MKANPQSERHGEPSLASRENGASSGDILAAAMGLATSFQRPLEAQTGTGTRLSQKSEGAERRPEKGRSSVDFCGHRQRLTVAIDVSMDGKDESVTPERSGAYLGFLGALL